MRNGLHLLQWAPPTEAYAQGVADQFGRGLAWVETIMIKFLATSMITIYSLSHKDSHFEKDAASHSIDITVVGPKILTLYGKHLTML